MTTRTPLPPIDGLRAYALGRVELRCDDCGQPIVWRWVPGCDVDAARDAHGCPVDVSLQSGRVFGVNHATPSARQRRQPTEGA